MGLRDVRDRAIGCLREGRVQAEVRSGPEEKNLLKTGEVSPGEVIDLLKATKGSQYSKSRHHFIEDIEVHIFKPIRGNFTWYLKLYFLDLETWFISVHKKALRKKGTSKKIVRRKNGNF